MTDQTNGFGIETLEANDLPPKQQSSTVEPGVTDDPYLSKVSLTEIIERHLREGLDSCHSRVIYRLILAGDEAITRNKAELTTATSQESIALA